MIERRSSEHVDARRREADEGQNEHVGHAAAHQITNGKIDGAETHGRDVGDDLRERRRQCEEHRSHPRASELRTRGNHVARTRKHRARRDHDHGRQEKADEQRAECHGGVASVAT